MDISRILMMYFSPNGKTKQICCSLGVALAQLLGAEEAHYDFTYPAQREAYPKFSADTLTIFASPVYAGRIPNVLLPYLYGLSGCGFAVPIAVFGNRNDDKTLTEWKRLLLKAGFVVPAAAAFIGAHSFSEILAAGRPDLEDMATMQRFSEEIVRRSKLWGAKTEVKLPFDGEELRYYRPQTQDGRPLDFLKARPVVSEKCIQCGACAAACPMGSIDSDGSNNGGICIKCNACVKVCAQKARAITAPDYIAHKLDLEMTCTERKEAACYFA